MSKKFIWGMTLLVVLGLAGSLAAQQDSPPPGQAPGGQAAGGQGPGGQGPGGQGPGGQGPGGQGPGGRRMGGPPPVLGTITSVGVDRFEIKTPDGTTQTVMVSDQTRIGQRQEGQQPQQLALEDLKVGDHVMVRGTPNADKQVAAMAVNRVTAEEFQRFQSGGGPGGGQGGPGGGRGGFGGGMGPGGGGPRMGGEIVSISGNQIKVQGRQGGERIIVVNDQTTFMKQGQAIALKDLKVGDRIFATGKEANGQFTATEVRTGMGRPGGGRGGAQGPPPQN